LRANSTCESTPLHYPRFHTTTAGRGNPPFLLQKATSDHRSRDLRKAARSPFDHGRIYCHSKQGGSCLPLMPLCLCQRNATFAYEIVYARTGRCRLLSENVSTDSPPASYGDFDGLFQTRREHQGVGDAHRNPTRTHDLCADRSNHFVEHEAR